VAAVDTTGAGDAFLAGFLAARLAGGSLAQSLERACGLGALAATMVGGRPPGTGGETPAGAAAPPAESACKAPGLVPS
jgi:sugar/nucleoside kinase (ribokinase family)